MIEKTIQFTECEGCGGFFSENLMHHIEDEYAHTEADLCDECLGKLQAKFEAAYG